MWTIAHKKCWIADRLARKGLCHPTACPLCDQTDETIDHLLVSCVFSRQVWFAVLHDLGLQALAPQAGERFFEDWWASTSSRVSDQVQKGVNSITILSSWSLWNHCNQCVFDGINPNPSSIIRIIKEEMQQWSFVGARGVSHLLALAAPAPAPAT